MEKELSKKQVLIRGFEIGITGGDTIQSQLKLAEAMTELQEETKADESKGKCYSCINARDNGCYPKEGTAQAEYEGYGWCSIVINCNKYKSK